MKNLPIPNVYTYTDKIKLMQVNIFIIIYLDLKVIKKGL